MSPEFRVASLESDRQADSPLSSSISSFSFVIIDILVYLTGLAFQLDLVDVF